MADETVGLDPERATLLATACGEAGVAAGEMASEVRVALTSAWLPTRSAILLSEVEHEFSTLRRVIDGTVERARTADSWSHLMPSGIAERLVTELAELTLWESLNDRTGAAAVDVAPFELFESFRVMGQGQWRAWMTPPGCESFGPGRYYTGGGALQGPDNRLYPVVVPHYLTDDGQHFTIDADITGGALSAASLGGADPGWTMVDYRTGIDRVQAEPGGWLPFTTGVAAATGLKIALGVDDVHLTAVHLRAGSAARLVDASPVSASAGPIDSGRAAHTDPEPTVWLMVDGRVVEYPISKVPTQRLSAAQRKIVPRLSQTSLGRLQAAEGLLSLATGVFTGFVAARDLDHGRHRAYEVMFEEHADGRRRARVQTFTLESKQWGVELYGWHMFVDDQGVPRQSPVAYQFGPSLTSPAMRFAHNPDDPDFETGLGMPAFAATAD